VHSRRVLPVVVSVGSTLLALAALVPVAAPSRSVGREDREERPRRVRPLRERFRAEVEQATRGESLRDESIGERDAFDTWFFQQRAYPAAMIPADAIGRGFSFARSHNDDSDEHDGEVGVWRALGPATIPDGQTDTSNGGPPSRVSGRVTAIAVNPQDPDTVYVGGAQGGVWKTSNASDPNPTWTPLTDHEASLAVGSIAIDPVNSDIIYVGTGEPNRSCDSYYGRGILRSLDGGRNWVLLGGGGSPLANPGPFAGKAVARIIVDPATAGSKSRTTLWASTTIGVYTSGTISTCATPSGLPFGLWRSRDSGRTWELQNVPSTAPGPGSFSVQDMALDPRNHEVLYAAVRSDGVWRSTNAATGNPAVFTKTAAGFPTGSPQTALRRINLGIAGRGAPGTLFAAVENSAGSRLFGLFKTTNGGASWAHVDNGKNGTAAVATGSRIVNWVSGPLFETGGVWNGRRIIFNNQFSLTITNVVNAKQLRLTATAPYPGASGVAAWSVGNYPNYCDGQCFYDMTVAVDPTDPSGNRLFVGGNPHTYTQDQGVPATRSHYNWRSDDGGINWRSISQGEGSSDPLHTDDHAVAFDSDGVVYDGNDGGIWRSDDHGNNWTSLNTNLAITQFQGVSTHPSDPKIVLGGTQDNGTNILNAALQPPPAWFHSDFGDGGQSLIDQSSPARMLHTYFNQSFNFMGPAKSTNGGSTGPGTWDFVGAYYGYQAYGDYYNGMDPKDPVSFYAPMAQHPAFTPNLVYFGSDKVYRSTDPRPTLEQVHSWTAVSPPLTKGNGNYLGWIGVLPNLIAGKEVLYTGASDGRIAVSAAVDGSGVAAWKILDNATTPNRAVTGIAVAASDRTGNTAYVTFSGFNGNTPATPGHVYVTRNGLSGAATWTNISGDLPDIPINGVIFDPARKPAIYVASDIGVFRSRDGGQHWKLLSKGLPFVTVFGLERNASTGQIVASTHGRGMFELVREGDDAEGDHGGDGHDDHGGQRDH
jgi:photosystem II stability/assembly factor-like uncharacterized protein